MTLGTEVEGISVKVDADLSGLTKGMQDAPKMITAAANGPIKEAALQMRNVFQSVGHSIQDALTRAAETGTFYFKEMVTSILRDLQRLAVKKFITGPLNDVIGGIFKKLPFGGGRALGGPVMANQSYLVGEQGPELFVPAGQGTILPAKAMTSPTPVTVHFHMPAGTDMASFQRSESQISAVLARAMARGQRNL